MAFGYYFLPDSLDGCDLLDSKPKGPAILGNNHPKRPRRLVRQRIQWSEVGQEWIADFVTKVVLELEQGEAAAEITWEQWCFDLDCKIIDEFPEPVTKAEAYAAWTNEQYSWESCARWWGHNHNFAAVARRMDEDSRSRISTRLKLG